MYEVCLGREVRQYHQEKDAHGKSISKRNPDWSLGTFLKSRPQKLDARAQLENLSGPELIEVLESYDMKSDGLFEKRELVDEIMSKVCGLVHVYACQARNSGFDKDSDTFLVLWYADHLVQPREGSS